MSDQPLIKLSDGNLIPQLGLGVWQASPEQARSAASGARPASIWMIALLISWLDASTSRGWQ